MEDKKNILTEFINFIKRIFRNKEPKQIPEKIELSTKQNLKSNFYNELKLYKEDSTLLKLQEQYENTDMNLHEMSNEQINDLNLLYERQISELKKKLNEKKTELYLMQHKIKNYSTNI